MSEKRSFFLQREGDGVELLQQRVTRLGSVECVLPARGGLAGFPLHPLPDLGLVRRIGENDQMLVGGLGDLMFDLPPLTVVGQAMALGRGTWYATMPRFWANAWRVPAIEPSIVTSSVA